MKYIDIRTEDLSITENYSIDTSSIELRLRRALKPPPRLKISEWADTNRILSTSTSAYAGRWQTSRVPYMKFIMDVVTEPYVEQITLVMCSQVGKTELLNNIQGYYIDNDPCPIMFVMPTKDLVEDYSKRSFASMIRESDCFKGKISIDKKSSSNNIDYKEFKGGLIKFVGSQKANALASVPIRILLGDEIDRFARDADGEGNPINLAKKRTTNFPNRKWILCSTPTVDGNSPITEEYESSSKHRYNCECPHCFHKQVLKWSNVKWEKGQPETARYMCDSCGSLWDDLDRYKSIDNGEWVAENPNITWNLGFHLPRMASGFCKLSDVVKEFIDAKGDTKKLKVFVNTVLAETWKDAADETSPSALMERAEDYDKYNIPNGVMLLTAGVDVQKDRLECMIVGWGKLYEAWVIDYVVLIGDPLQVDVWNKLDDLLKKGYYSKHYEQELRVSYYAVDSGYLPMNAYEYVYVNNTLTGVMGYATKGLPSISRGSNPLYNRKQIERYQEVKNAMKPFSVGTYEAKTMLCEFFNYENERAGYWHFHKGLTIDFYEQLTSEKKYLEFIKGKEYFTWQKPNSSVRNEALDVAVLNLWCIHVSNEDLDTYENKLNNNKNPREIKPLKFPKSLYRKN